MTKEEAEAAILKYLANGPIADEGLYAYMRAELGYGRQTGAAALRRLRKAGLISRTEDYRRKRTGQATGWTAWTYALTAVE